MIELLKQPRTWFVPYTLAVALARLLPRTPTDLETFFWPSALVALRGQPLFVYSAHSLDTYPNANGPVGLVPLVVVRGWIRSSSSSRVPTGTPSDPGSRSGSETEPSSGS